MFKISKELVLLITLGLMLCSCSGDSCIDADDFGFNKFTVSARYDNGELSTQTNGVQVAPWRDSGFTVNGRPLSIVVRTWVYGSEKNTAGELSAWCPWYGTSDNGATLSTFAQKLQNCIFIDGNMYTNTNDAQISNPPCILTNGIGLYTLIATPNTDPNSSYLSQKSPSGITMHLGEPTVGYKLYDFSLSGQSRVAGGVIYKYNDNPTTQQQYLNGKLYFKILDKFYDDNYGQYKVIIKSGVNDSRADPISYLTSLVTTTLFGTNSDYGIIKTIYLNLTQNTAYRTSVIALLSLYIMFTAFSFLIGNLNITHTELIVRVIKVGIVSALLSSKYSWSFFNDYLFVYFIGGIQQILAMIQEAGATGPGSTSILNLMLAPQTMAKLFSLLFIDWRGFIYIMLFIVALYFLVMMIFQATIIYLTALITIGMIIVMGPIFICFLLFNITRSLFENWLRQLISYGLQPVILFTGIVFISMIIRTEIYSSLGFRVCKHDFPNLGDINSLVGGSQSDILDDSLVQSIFYWWFPSPMQASGFTKIQAVIPVPEDYTKPDGTICQAYGCFDTRYVELPFLDPNTDQRRINNFFQGNFVQLDGLLLIFVSIYLLSKFNEITISLARFLSGSSGNLTNIQQAGTQSFGGMERLVSRYANNSWAKATAGFNNAITKRTGIDFARMPENISSAAATWYENRQVSQLENDALIEGNANRAVIQEIERNYGMDRKDLKENAAKNYKETLIEALWESEQKSANDLQRLMPKRNQEKVKQEFIKQNKDKINELSQKGPKEISNALAEFKFGEGKTYDALSDAQKKAIDEILKFKNKDITLRDSAIDAQFARDYQKAYVESYQALSNRGVGLIGKRVKLLRSWQELEYRVQEKRDLNEAKKINFAERLYSGYEGLKRSALTAVVGEKVRNAIEGDLTGAAWQGFQYDDPRFRTYNETLLDKDRENRYQTLKIQINQETVKNGDDILKPEFLVKINNPYYEELANKKLQQDIYNYFTSGSDPILKGYQFIKEQVGNEGSIQIIDKLIQGAKQFIEADRYIRRESYYESLRDKALDVIKAEYKLSNDKDRLDNKLINDIDYSNKVLAKIDARKIQIAQATNEYIDKINTIRAEQGFDRYEKLTEFVSRRSYSLDELLQQS